MSDADLYRLKSSPSLSCYCRTERLLSTATVTPGGEKGELHHHTVHLLLLQRILTSFSGCRSDLKAIYSPSMLVLFHLLCRRSDLFYFNTDDDEKEAVHSWAGRHHRLITAHWPLASVGAVAALVVWEAVEDSTPLLSATLWPAHIAFKVWKTAWGATFIFNRSTMILEQQGGEVKSRKSGRLSSGI